jgi:Zn-dependent protease with chaperone function
MACAAVTFGTAIGWAVAAAGARLVSCDARSARGRAVVLAQMRLLPLATVIILVAAQIHAFVRFEGNRPESPGPLLFGLALIGALLLLDASYRGLSMWRETARLTLRWRRAAVPLRVARWHGPAWVIRPVFPVVAVVGAVRPQLFVAQQVVDGCTPTEMAAIAAHESAHVAAWDNLTRWLFAITPGAALCRGVASVLEGRWLASAEEAADAAAARNADPLDLASALTKVARLAPADAPVLTAASALIGASDLEMRVRRLLVSDVQSQHNSTAWTPTILLLVTALVSQTATAGSLLHE